MNILAALALHRLHVEPVEQRPGIPIGVTRWTCSCGVTGTIVSLAEQGHTLAVSDYFAHVSGSK